MCCQPPSSSPQQDQTAESDAQGAAGEESDAQGAAGGDLPQDMQGRRFPSLDLPAITPFFPDLPMSCWSELPRDVLECILDRINEHRDVLLFSSVCVAWQSFTLENLQLFPRQLPLSRCLPKQCQLPLLMIPSTDATKACDFFCVFEHKLYGGTPLPDSNKWIWGSSNGWLVTVDIAGRCSEIYLFNPTSRAQIYLPSKDEIRCDTNQYWRDYFYWLPKAALSSRPASNIEDCVVMAIISTTRVLSFCRPGDNKWTNVDDSPRDVDDIIYYKELFYAVTMYGVVVACDTGPSPKATAVVRRPKVYVDHELSRRLIYEKKYLVESRGALLQVVRMVDGGKIDEAFSQYRTIDFQIFELQEKGSEEDDEDEDEMYESLDEKFVPVENRSYKWVKTENLHDQVIFLGLNQSFSLPAYALPNSRGNCIYFTDDYMDYYHGRHCNNIPERCADMGVFNLEDGSVHPFNLKNLVFPIPPVWVSPAPW